MSESYDLNSTDLDILEAVILLLRKLSEPLTVRPDQLVSISKLLHVASSAPRVCRSVNASVSIWTRTKQEEFSPTSSWQFSAFDSSLSVTTGRCEYNPAIGGDWCNEMKWSIRPTEKSKYNDRWDEEWMVPELQYHPERKLNIDLRSGDYEIMVEDHENELLGDYGQDEDEAS